MDDDENKALVHRPGTELVGEEHHGSPVIARIAKDVAIRAEAHHVSQARFRIGDYLLCEPDYRQILHWAEALRMAPEEVLTELSACRRESEEYGVPGSYAFVLESGSIVSMVWDFDRLPLIPWPWQEGLLINTLVFSGRWPDDSVPLRPRLPWLRTLVCDDIGQSRRGFVLSELGKNLRELDLSGVPGLTRLACGNNELKALNLSPVPNLSKLDCSRNRLSKLNLSPVPNLSKLDCSGNLVSWLDLSPVPNLTTLRCAMTWLTELDLSPVPNLSELDCHWNGLAELDLSPVPNLSVLACHWNVLTELDLSPVPNLSELDCFTNGLTELDLSPVPNLSKLDCSGNGLAELDLSPVPNLKTLGCDKSVLLHNAPANLRVQRN